MTAAFNKLLISIEDDLNDMGEFADVPQKIIGEDIEASAKVFEKLKKNSGLFYKIINHHNLLPLIKQFEKWIDEEKRIFSFYSHIELIDTFKSVLAIASKFEHQDDKKILIVSPLSDYSKYFGDQGCLSSSSYSNNFETYELGDSLDFINYYNLTCSITLKNISEYEKTLEEITSNYDLIFVVFPREIHTEALNNQVKALLLKCSNINYIFNKSGTHLDEIEKIRNFYKKTGLEEGGVIWGESDE